MRLPRSAHSPPAGPLRALCHAQSGDSLLLENIQENVDAVLDPVMGRNFIRKGKSIKIKLGDKAIDYDSHFRLFLQTKLSNPHYRPEIQAQTTLVNFTVTEEGQLARRSHFHPTRTAFIPSTMCCERKTCSLRNAPAPACLLVFCL